jgi:hypothetical protein
MHAYTMRGKTLRRGSLLDTIVSHTFSIVQVVNSDIHVEQLSHNIITAGSGVYYRIWACFIELFPKLTYLKYLYAQLNKRYMNAFATT